MNIEKLEPIIKLCWDKNTSTRPDFWNVGNPANGQAIATALVVQDYFKGKIINVQVGIPEIRRISHYLNELPDKSYLDLTFQQFPSEGIYFRVSKKKYISRKRLLSRYHNQYNLLKTRVTQLLSP